MSSDLEHRLAAVAARELARPAQAIDAGPYEQLWAAMRLYVRWALRYPERFRLTFGRWTGHAEELGQAADAARSDWVRLVAAAQGEGRLPAGDPERVTALLLATAHGAASLALTGHLARDGKGRASAEDIVDDLFVNLGRR